MTPLFLDIETIPGQRPELRQRYFEKAAEAIAAINEREQRDLAAVAPPSNYKDAAKVQAWWFDTGEAKKAAIQSKAEIDRVTAEKDADIEWRKTALDGAYGQVVVIGFALADGETVTLLARDLTIESERGLLQSCFSLLQAELDTANTPASSLQWVGHNVLGFDLRFLLQRCIVLRVKPPHWFLVATQARPWDVERVFDTMVQWAGAGGRCKLDKLCDALGIAGKGTGLEDEDLDGAHVWDYVRDGRIEEVATYCEGDVLRARSIHRQMTFAEAA